MPLPFAATLVVAGPPSALPPAPPKPAAGPELPAVGTFLPAAWLDVPPLPADGFAKPLLPFTQPLFALLLPLLAGFAELLPLPLFGTGPPVCGHDGAVTPDSAYQKQVTQKMMRSVAISARFTSCFPV